jgi:hypothetical protein
MDAKDILEKNAVRTGWNVDSMLEIACRYIDNQQSSAAFADFVSQAADEEDPPEVIEVGDEVDVPEPKPDDLWNFAFTGQVIDFKNGDLVVVEDQDGNVYDVERGRLTLAED